MKSFQRRPKRGDDILVTSREEQGLRADGKIILVDHDMQEVTVKYSGRKIIRVLNYFEWNGHFVSNCHFVIDGVMHHHSIEKSWLHPGGDYDSFTFEDLLGNWSTREGGEGRWVL